MLSTQVSCLPTLRATSPEEMQLEIDIWVPANLLTFSPNLLTYQVIQSLTNKPTNLFRCLPRSRSSSGRPCPSNSTPTPTPTPTPNPNPNPNQECTLEVQAVLSSAHLGPLHEVALAWLGRLRGAHAALHRWLDAERGAAHIARIAAACPELSRVAPEAAKLLP